MGTMESPAAKVASREVTNSEREHGDRDTLNGKPAMVRELSRPRLYTGAQDLIRSGGLAETQSLSSSIEHGQKETWIVQEFCDFGSLSSAVHKNNVFGHVTDGGGVSAEALRNILLTARDICSGMVYLHK